VSSAIDLYWIPLGAGGWFVRMNGRLYERAAALRAGRRPRDLYHSALELRTGGERYVIEMAPVWNDSSAERGVVAEGAVGTRRAGRLRLLRYEIRCWRNGRIPDMAEAVGGARHLSSDPGRAAEMLRRVHEVPLLVWGRDEAGTGDMWNSNSLISWLVVTCGLDQGRAVPPAGGRAPGWQAGLSVARHQMSG